MVDAVPPWLESMRADLGQEEIPGPANNPRIIAKARLPGVKFPAVPGLVKYGQGYNSDDEQAWCGGEEGGSFAEVGVMPPFNAANDEGSYLWAASWRTWGVHCDMRVGAAACYDGHVNMVDEMIDADTFWGIGGNQGSPNGGAVTRSRRKRSSVLAFRWPDDASLQQAGLIQFSLSAKVGSVTTTTRPLIEKGATGGFVSEVQKILGITATGIFDAATDAAVRSFQATHGLDVDGQVGPNTWKALLGGSITIAGDVPHAAEYLNEWQRMEIKPEHAGEIETIARRLLGNKARYQAAVSGTNVPWYFVAIIHDRESGGDFSRNIHNGQPLGQVTTEEPLGRGPFGTFEASVHDWIVLKALDKVSSWPLERFAYQCETNNGMGYRNKGVPSAYLWSFTTIYQGGKYVADHVWSATAMDKQCGTMPLLKALMAIDASIVLTAPQPPASKPLDGEVLDPIKPGEKSDTPAPLSGIGAALLLLITSIGKSTMPNDSTQPGQGPDLSKLVTDIQKIGAVLRNPALQKLLGGGAVTLDEMLSVLPVLSQLLPGHGLTPLPPPTGAPAPMATPAAPVTVEPVPVAPAPATTSASANWTNLKATLALFLGSQGLAAADVMGTMVGPSQTLTGMLVPIAIGVAGAFGIPAPVVTAAQAGISLLAGLIANKKPKA